ncbi:outer membrane beta-barrel protein [Salinarimonas rosea]|uniref:outer membrane beta-barrel protein n=1 Tax=Salinarimonas rosea TaxID=552063 RepID=UPI00041FE1C9|nr:outer membrane beta-barrel protein [Salinarimonas rosea]
MPTRATRRRATRQRLASALAAGLVAVGGIVATGGVRAQDAAAVVARQPGDREPTEALGLRPAARDPLVFAPVRAEVRVPVTRLAPSPPAPRAVPRAAAEDDPYAPLGIRAGALTLRPALTQSLGWDTNPERAETGAKGRALSRTEGVVTLESDWSRHALTGSARGTYDAYRGGDPEPRFSGAADVGLRLDIGRDSALTLGASAATATERVGSPELPGDLADGPQTSTLAASAAFDTRLNRLALGLRGGVSRTVNEDATRLDGTRLDRSGDDVTEASAALRVGYEISPRLVPFVEAEIDRRRYDEAGTDRDSIGRTGRVGASVEITRLLAGEVSAGWQVRSYEDAARREVDGTVAEARLVWTPTPLTTVTLAGESRLAETNVAGARAAEARRASLAVSHAVRRNVVLDAALSVAQTDYPGSTLSEELVTASAGAEWRLNRALALTGRYTHERLDSTAAGADYVADVALIGLRIAR